MRFVFVILFLCCLSTSWATGHCDGLNGDLKKLASDYLDAMKSLSNTLMTTPNITPNVKPDISKVQKAVDATNTLMVKCKKDDLDKHNASQSIKSILHKVSALDKDLQKMGTFDNGALNTARINAVEKSNAFMASLLWVHEEGTAKTKKAAKAKKPSKAKKSSKTKKPGKFKKATKAKEPKQKKKVKTKKVVKAKKTDVEEVEEEAEAEAEEDSDAESTEEVEISDDDDSTVDDASSDEEPVDEETEEDPETDEEE